MASNMKLAYFTHGDVSISETFIYDLIKGLDKEFDLTFISGKKGEINKIISNQMASGYAESGGNMPYHVYKIGQVLGGKGFEYKGKAFQHFANKSLNKIKEEFDVAYIEYSTSAVLLMDYLYEKNVPFVVHVHGYDITAATTYDTYYQQKLKELFNKANHFIAASYYMKRLLVLLGCPEDKISVIRLGIDGTKISPKSWEERLETNPKIVFLGRLTRKKHPIALLHAFKIVKDKIPNATLTIVGDGELSKDVESRIESLGLTDSVELLGALPREKSFKYLNESWIYAQHSVTALSGDQEGYAISPAEAALHELPVVSTYHNGIPEHVIDGKTGFLVKEYDYETMGERIIEFIENPDVAEKMGKAGRINILELNNPERRIKEISYLLKSIH